MSSPQAIVTIHQNHVYTSSLLVAEKFEKKHFHVLRDIESIIQNCPDRHFRESNFGCTFRNIPGPKNSVL